MINQSTTVSVGRQPILLATIPYTVFTASATYTKAIDKALTRNAKARTFTIVNTLNQAITGPTVLPYESTLGVGMTISGESTIFANVALNSKLSFTSETRTQSNAHVDSVSFGLPMGAIVPTSGEVKIYVYEII